MATMAYNGNASESMKYAGLKTGLAGKLFGEKSEIYCTHLEELTNLLMENMALKEALQCTLKL